MSVLTRIVLKSEAREHFEKIGALLSRFEEVLVLTDPPFFTGKRFWWQRDANASLLAYDDPALSHDQQLQFHRDWMRGYLSTGQVVYFAIFCDMQSEFALRTVSHELGVPLRAEIILKEQGQGVIRKSYRAGYFFEHVKLLVFSATGLAAPENAPRAFFVSPEARSIWSGAASRGFISGYPTEKSHEMALEIVRWLARNPSTVVVDPFAGSGALLSAARQLGYSTIGSDSSETAFEYLQRSI